MPFKIDEYIANDFRQTEDFKDFELEFVEFVKSQASVTWRMIRASFPDKESWVWEVLGTNAEIKSKSVGLVTHYFYEKRSELKQDTNKGYSAFRLGKVPSITKTVPDWYFYNKTY